MRPSVKVSQQDKVSQSLYSTNCILHMYITVRAQAPIRCNATVQKPKGFIGCKLTIANFAILHLKIDMFFIEY